MLLTVVGFPRSGTSFLHRLLAHYTDGPAMEPWTGVTGEHPEIKKIHWQYQFNDTAVVYIVRDPRDTAVSGYFYYLNAFGWMHQHDISNLSLLDFLKTGFSEGFKDSNDRVLWPRGWREHTEWWLAKDTVCTTYEQLMEDRASELKWLLYYLGIPEDGAQLQYAIEQSHTFGGLRVPYIHDPGWADAEKTVHPTVGEWKKHFGARETAFIQEYCGDLMRQLGYKWTAT